MKISLATHADIEQMIQVCALNLVRNNRAKFTDEDFSKKGFLITPLTEEVARQFIDDPKNYLACVAKEGEEVLGYLTACDVEKCGINFSAFAEIENQKNFYYKQIAKKPDAKNIGKDLLFAMLAEAKSRGYSNVLCRIVNKPFYNKVSTVFHERFGFKKIGEMEEDGALLGVYLKRL